MPFNVRRAIAPLDAGVVSTEKYVLLSSSPPGARNTNRMSLPRKTKLPRSVVIVIVPTRPDGVCEPMVTARATPGFRPGTDVYVARYCASAAFSVGASSDFVHRKRGDRSQ